MMAYCSLCRTMSEEKTLKKNNRLYVAVGIKALSSVQIIKDASTDYVYGNQGFICFSDTLCEGKEVRVLSGALGDCQGTIVKTGPKKAMRLDAYAFLWRGAGELAQRQYFFCQKI